MRIAGGKSGLNGVWGSEPWRLPRGATAAAAPRVAGYAFQSGANGGCT
jgi:hypothetical protein